MLHKSSENQNKVCCELSGNLSVKILYIVILFKIELFFK